MIRIFYPEPVYKLLKALAQHKVYVVGGFVRDMLLSGRGGEFVACHPREGGDPFPSGSSTDPYFREYEKLKDIDLVTPDALEVFLPTIQKLSPRYHITEHYQAVQFGFEGYQVTLTRLRYDAVCDGRQADVVFVDTLQEDVWRRDFTINALYADAEGQAIDFVGGYQDLAQKKVRFIGDPATRIKEDVLRILRYVRFCSLLGVSVDPTLFCPPREGADPLVPSSPMDFPLCENDSGLNHWQHEIKKILKLPLGKQNLNQLMSKNGGVA